MLIFFFIATTLLSLAVFYYGVGKDKRVLVLSIAWLLIIGLIANSGYFENTLAKPPRFLFAVLVPIALSVWIYRAVRGNKLNTNYLVAVHILRIPVELVLYQLFLQKKVPVFMTFKGWNFDILVGISAIFVFLYLLFAKKKPSRSFISFWNIVGLAFLITIVTIAIFASPLPLQQLAFDQPNIAVLEFPYIYLPTFIVPVVFISHILAIKMNQI